MKFLSFLLVSMLFFVSCNSQNAAQVLNPTAFSQKINETNNAFVLDVRTPEEFAEGYIANAQNINYNGSNFEAEIAKLDKSKTYFVYCLSGKRSASAASYMRTNGFKNVINLEGGILTWQNKNLPLVTASTAPVVDKISIYDGKVKVIRLDINENKQLAKQLNIVEIPVLKIFENGKETWNHNGFITKEDLKKQL